MVQTIRNIKNGLKDTNNLTEALIDRYLPADYHDTYHQVINTQRGISPEDLLIMMFGDSLTWVKGLLKFRDLLVKPFGIETGKMNASQWITEKTEQEAILEKDDKHLKFYVSVQITTLQDNERDIKITTVVKYHNRLGRIYFFFVRPFHRIIVPIGLKRTLKPYRS